MKRKRLEKGEGNGEWPGRMRDVEVEGSGRESGDLGVFGEVINIFDNIKYVYFSTEFLFNKVV
jgi:hypothetical protein